MDNIVDITNRFKGQVKTVFIHTHALDKERFARLESIVTPCVNKYDERTRTMLIAECMKTYVKKSDEEMIELVNNPLHEKEWSKKAIKWAAVIAVLRLRQIV